MGDQIVMVVDDDVDTLEFVDYLLTSHNIKTILVSEPSRAYQIVKAQRPALLILDLNMYGDPSAGVKVLAQIRADAHTTQLPVLLYSATLYSLYEAGSNVR